MGAFFDRLDHLREDQLLALRAAWHASGRQEHEGAWTAVRAVGARDGLTGEIDRVRNKALAWTTRSSNSIPYLNNVDRAWHELKMEAGEAIVDAALAIALGGRLDEGARSVLMEPWLRATEGVE